MSDLDPSDPKALETFVRLSSGLTGYSVTELWGTGMAQKYFEVVLNATWKDAVLNMLNRADDPQGLMGDHLLGPVARAVIKLWYLGQWHIDKVPPLHVAFSVSPDAYVQSLAWQAMGGHPQGARQPGYGSWSVPPVGVKVDDPCGDKGNG